MVIIVRETSARNPRSRRWRNARRAVVTLAVLIALAVLLYFVALPLYARSRINALLRDLGVNDPKYTVHRVSLSGLQITDVRLQRNTATAFEAQRIDVRYSPMSLWNGRIEAIGADGIVWRIAIRNGEIDWGFLPPPADRAGMRAIHLPFDALWLRDGKVVIDDNGWLITAPIDGSMSAVEDPSRSGGNARANCALQTGVIRAGEIELPPLHASASLIGLRVDVQATWPILQEATIAASGVIDLTAPGFACNIDAHVPQFTLRDRAQLIRLFPALAGIEIRGRYALDGHCEIAGGRVQPEITLRAADVALDGKSWPITINSAAGTLVFDSLFPLHTKGPQRIDIASAASGELQITSATIVADLHGPTSLKVEQAQWTLADGGRFGTGVFTVNPQQPRIETTVTCENVDLNFWLKLISQDRAEGQGRLLGEFAVVWDPSARPRLQFTGGLLTAQDQSGFIRTFDAGALDTLLDQADPRFTLDEDLKQVKQRIIDALRDFGYTSLTFQFIPDGRDTTLQAQLKGKGRSGPDAQEFGGLEINIHHFAETLQNVLSAKSALNRRGE